MHSYLKFEMFKLNLMLKCRDGNDFHCNYTAFKADKLNVPWKVSTPKSKPRAPGPVKRLIDSYRF